ncbi:MAG: PorT family protein [Cyclobacteriaceae bacterium]
MRKFLLLFFILFFAGIVQAQPKIGLTFSPTLSTNRVKYKSAQGDISNNGLAMRFKFGLEADFEVTETYAFSTGLIYAPKRAGFSIEPNGGQVIEEAYKAQYLQIPITMKLYTSEVLPDVKGFFQIGLLGEFKVFDEALGDSYTLVEAFKPFDTSFVFGIGAEYDAGTSSILYASIVYNRGLINAISKVESGVTEDLSTRMDMFGIQMGIKF